MESFVVADYLELPFGTVLAQNMEAAFKSIKSEIKVNYRSYEAYVVKAAEEKVEAFGKIMEKYENVGLVASNNNFFNIYVHFDIQAVKDYERTGSSTKDTINKQRLFRILQIPSTSFAYCTPVPYSSNVPADEAGSYESVVRILIQWIVINLNEGNPNLAKKFVGIQKSAQFLEIALFASRAIQFSKFSHEFIHDTVDCGLFDDRQMLDIYRSMPVKRRQRFL
ncbi:hypothetical protein HK098_002459 [Nowakowskiella sp. JEL0407]|nr:hypothetical protein HK098_002459 [Nowakowskiella sp. JEL0407]